ncbi:MAG TPA: acyltransferase [Kineosporiaceae bacterium]
MVIRTLAPKARICIGPDVGMSGGSICSAVSVVIGRGSMLGADVTIADTDFHPIDTEDRRYRPLPEGNASDAVVIGNNVFLGTRTVVLKGVTIGDNSVIGAGSVVTRDIPGNSVAAGQPAKVIRCLSLGDAGAQQKSPQVLMRGEEWNDTDLFGQV